MSIPGSKENQPLTRAEKRSVLSGSEDRNMAVYIAGVIRSLANSEQSGSVRVSFVHYPEIYEAFDIGLLQWREIIKDIREFQLVRREYVFHPVSRRMVSEYPRLQMAAIAAIVYTMRSDGIIDATNRIRQLEIDQWQSITTKTKQGLGKSPLGGLIYPPSSKDEADRIEKKLEEQGRERHSATKLFQSPFKVNAPSMRHGRAPVVETRQDPLASWNKVTLEELLSKLPSSLTVDEVGLARFGIPIEVARAFQQMLAIAHNQDLRSLGSEVELTYRGLRAILYHCIISLRGHEDKTLQDIYLSFMQRARKKR